MATKTFCDRCGREIRGSEQVFNAGAEPNDNQPGGWTPEFKEICLPCVKDMFRVLPQEKPTNG